MLLLFFTFFFLWEPTRGERIIIILSCFWILLLLLPFVFFFFFFLNNKRRYNTGVGIKWDQKSSLTLSNWQIIVETIRRYYTSVRNNNYRNISTLLFLFSLLFVKLMSLSFFLSLSLSLSFFPSLHCYLIRNYIHTHMYSDNVFISSLSRTFFFFLFFFFWFFFYIHTHQDVSRSMQLFVCIFIDFFSPKKIDIRVWRWK